MKQFKYKTIIGAELLPSKIKDTPNLIESKASLLRNLTPYLNEKDHADLFGAAFEIALINQFNENGDGIASEDCHQLVQGFRLKQLNLEHDRSMIVGHVLEGTFCERAFGKELYYEDILGSKEVFSLVLSSVVYKLANEQLTKLLSRMASMDEDEEGEEDDRIYASWEIGFNKYDLAVGPRKLSECEIISDPVKQESYSKYLKSNGGSGKISDGMYVQRLIRGEILPLGGGLTTNPAAKVKSIFVVDPVMNGREEEVLSSKEENKKKIDSKSSQSICEDVTTNETDTFGTKNHKEGKENMNEEQVKQLIEEAFASKAKASEREEAVASVTNRILEAIREKNEAFVAEKKAIAEQKEQAEAKVKEQESKITELQESVESVKGELAKASEELKQMKEDREKLESQATFDSRMDEIKSIYALDDALVEIVAKRLSGIETDEQYEELKKEFSITLAHVDRETIKAKEEEAKASKEEGKEKTPEEDLEKGGKEEASASAASNNSQKGSEEEQTLAQRFSKAFTKDTVEIK